MTSVSRRHVVAAAGGAVLGSALFGPAAHAQVKRSFTIAIQFGTSHLATSIADKISSGELKEAPAKWQDVFVDPINLGQGS